MAGRRLSKAISVESDQSDSTVRRSSRQADRRQSLLAVDDTDSNKHVDDAEAQENKDFPEGSVEEIQVYGSQKTDIDSEDGEDGLGGDGGQDGDSSEVGEVDVDDNGAKISKVQNSEWDINKVNDILFDHLPQC